MRAFLLPLYIRLSLIQGSFGLRKANKKGANVIYYKSSNNSGGGWGSTGVRVLTEKRNINVMRPHGLYIYIMILS